MAEEKKENKESIYQTLSKIDVTKYLKKKMGLSYLSWATAWGLVKSHYPDATKEITEYPEYIPTKEGWIDTGRTVDYRLTPFGCEVEVKVKIGGQESVSNLYVMDHRNKPVKAQNLDMGQINKTQQRCLVKALANAGLGLEVYAGEDLPSDEDETAKKAPKKQTQPSKQPVSRPKHNFSESQLVNYAANYQPTPESPEKKMLLSFILLKAQKGDKLAQGWWEKTRHEGTIVGEAVRQYEKLVPILEQRSADKQKKLQDSLNKIKRPNEKKSA